MPTTLLDNDLKNEFSTLYAEFIDEYLKTPKGEKHSKLCSQSRAEGIKNFNHVKELKSKGEDITDFVLLKLLPHTNT